ncbi:hypothetical protein GGR56DRAFT_646496 [Xylariaceae sp. FL0804]|nr:hypothetical protein GGR56DRAFT_646496 [Xylariaceae sp. FL0804]
MARGWPTTRGRGPWQRTYVSTRLSFPSSRQYLILTCSPFTTRSWYLPQSRRMGRRQTRDFVVGQPQRRDSCPAMLIIMDPGGMKTDGMGLHSSRPLRAAFVPHPPRRSGPSTWLKAAAACVHPSSNPLVHGRRRAETDRAFHYNAAGRRPYNKLRVCALSLSRPESCPRELPRGGGQTEQEYGIRLPISFGSNSGKRQRGIRMDRQMDGRTDGQQQTRDSGAALPVIPSTLDTLVR